MSNDELQALLSAHAAGTLTPEEKKRLNQAALDNQAIFDAMAEEEPLRAALMSSLARQGLLRALQKPPKSNNWRWAALAACLAVGAATVAYWPTPKQATQEVAVATKPESIPETPPPPAPKPAPKARAIVPAQAPVLIAESTIEKREAKSVEQPQAPAAAVADAAAPAGNSFRERSASSVAKLAMAAPLPVPEIFNGNLILRAPETSQIYAFLMDGESIKPLTTANDKRRSIPLGSHSAQAEVWLVITTTEDPVLARALTGVLPLPTRNWIKLKTN